MYLVALQGRGRLRQRSNIQSFEKPGRVFFFRFPFCFLISGFCPFAGARGAEHPGLERGRVEWTETVAAAPQKRIGLVLMFVHLSSQALDKHCVIHLPTRGRGGAGRGARGSPGSRVPAFQPLTAPGTAAVSPRCPKIPADSSVGERGQRGATGGISWGLPLTRPSLQKGKWGWGGGGAMGPDSSSFLA